MKRLAFGLAISWLAACGGDGSGTPDAAPPGDDGSTDSAVDSPSGAFALTSPAYSEGMTIPTVHTCGNGGPGTSPQLDWAGAPVGTLSFAIIFTDLNNSLIHSIIYDIPATMAGVPTDGVPADVERAFAPTDVPGAHQTRAFDNNFGYAGPCPGETHTYEFALYAIDVATLPGATMNTGRAAAKTLIEMHDLAKVTLSGTYTP